MESLTDVEIPKPDKSLIADNIEFLKELGGVYKKSDALVEKLGKGGKRVKIYY